MIGHCNRGMKVHWDSEEIIVRSDRKIIRCHKNCGSRRLATRGSRKELGRNEFSEELRQVSL